jgi:hypothetical protein
MADEQTSQILVPSAPIVSELLIRSALLPGGKQKRVKEQSMKPFLVSEPSEEPAFLPARSQDRLCAAGNRQCAANGWFISMANGETAAGRLTRRC